MPRKRCSGLGLGLLLAVVVALSGWALPRQQMPEVPIDHIIVIYLENHSFDNLYGLFPGADGLANAAEAPPQTDLDGHVYTTLPQPVNTYLQPPAPDPRFPADLPNAPFDIGRYVPPEEKIGDLIHAYYRHQYQINGGRMDRFAYWSDAKGLAMGYYDTSGLPLARWAREYTLADRFFHAAFGGSFLNHFWLVCACTPVWPNAPQDVIAIPFPDHPEYLQDRSVRPDGYAVNTSQPYYPPYRPGTPDDHRLPPQTLPHIGDRLDAAGVSWAWYAGGWNAAMAGTPGDLFQYHHQPFNYFANVGGDPAARARHLKDEDDFLTDLREGTLPQVAWVKPYGTDNEHPGYADVITGELHVEELLRAIQQSRYWPRVAVIITYDEHGGFWDHVPPPVVDEWGPGERVPTLIISPWAKRGYIDHTEYDTTSILKFIEWRWNLPPLGPRDAAANTLLNAFDFTQSGR
ncbi:MAG TPA: alkaline phosphatase family protein [Chloroflexota bacterium]|nr:alkaline phosphatase family protein [Chloroflexota bacterium]